MPTDGRQQLLPFALALAVAGLVLLVFAGLEQAAVVLASAGAVCVYALWLRRRGRATAAAPPDDRLGRLAEQQARMRAQSELEDELRSAGSERDADLLLQRHVQRVLPGSTVVVLGREGESLRAKTPVPTGSAFSLQLVEARPDSCSAVRQGRPYERAPDGPEPLVPCRLCGVMPAASHCQPCFAGGEIIGSLLVMRADPLSETERELVGDSVRRASPVLGSLRSLALARSNAASDELTGLPTPQAAHETLKRMIAQAGRRIAPLSAVVTEVDFLQEIEDLCGRAKRDELLLAAARALTVTVRESDFVSHHGGARFVVLLPDTDERGAAKLAIKLRDAVAAIRIHGVERAVSASFGIAVFPRDGAAGDSLLRAADRAVHAARTSGGNRVEIVSG